MKRRALLVGGAASAALAATRVLAQHPGRNYRIGVLFPFPDSVEKYLPVLRERLATHGFTEGRNLSIASRYALTNADAAPELIELKPDAIFTFTAAATQVALAATNSVPIVFTAVADPVASGIVKDYARPGGNATGVSNRDFELAVKRLELIRELLPAAKRVAVAAADVFGPFEESFLRLAKAPAERLGIELVRAEAGGEGGSWSYTMQASVNAGAHAVLILTPFSLVARRFIVDEAVRSVAEWRIPAVFADVGAVEIGGLMSYATDPIDDLRRGADLLARILRGEKPANLPVDQAARFELAINLKTARSLGLKIPQSLLVRADRVIE
jgi:putative ABC transport system substrate-binding protein